MAGKHLEYNLRCQQSGLQGVQRQFIDDMVHATGEYVSLTVASDPSLATYLEKPVFDRLK
jgi:hypothetical protein